MKERRVTPTGQVRGALEPKCAAMPELASVIIVNHNGAHLLHECLEALLRQTHPSYEVIVVDNGSTDKSEQLVREKFPTVHFLKLGANLGFSGGNNRGIEAARGVYIVLLNNDAVPEPQWLEELCKAMKQNPRVGLCASRMMFYGTDRIDCTGLSWLVWGRSRNLGWREKCQEKHLQAREVFGACAGAALYRKKMLDEIGLFDEDFFLYAEDLDLSFRAQLAGYQCLYVPTAVVHHHAGATTGTPQGRARRVYYSVRNAEFVFIKNMPGQLILRYVGHHLLYLLALHLFWVFKGFGLSVLRADWAILRGLPQMLRRRKKIQANCRVSVQYIESRIEKETFAKLWRRQLNRLRSKNA